MRHTTRGVWLRHWFENCRVRVDSVDKWSVAFAVLRCEVPTPSICIVVASHRVTFVRDHGSNEINSPSGLYQSKKSFLPAALRHAHMVKSSREFCHRKAFGSFLNVYQIFLMPGLS